MAAAALFTHAAYAAKPGPIPPPPPPPSSGTLVLDYLYPSESWAENYGLTFAPSGTIYASGAAGGETSRAIVLASSDSGNSWSLVDVFPPPGRYLWWWDIPGGITSDGDGNVYVAGLTYDNYGIEPDQWYVRRSTDGGATWTTVDDFIPGPYPESSGDLTGIAVDAAGDVYVSGMANDVSGKQAWTIRKGVGGTSFSTVDVVPNSYFPAIFAHPTAGIFAVGRTPLVVTTRNKTTTSQAWLVRRSLDGGATWFNVDTFQLSISNGSIAFGMGADALGNLYVVGQAATPSRYSYINHWLVRKSSDGGDSWSTVDDFQPSGSQAGASRFAATSTGDLYVAGTTSSSNGTHWILRKNPGGTGAWSTIDDYQYAADYTAPHGIAADASGNLFVGGSGSGTGTTHWLVKRY